MANLPNLNLGGEVKGCALGTRLKYPQFANDRVLQMFTYCNYLTPTSSFKGEKKGVVYTICQYSKNLKGIVYFLAYLLFDLKAQAA